MSDEDGGADEEATDRGRGSGDAGDPLDDRLDDVVDAANDDPDADPFEAIGEGTGPRHGDPFDPFADAVQDDDRHADADDGGDAERAEPAQGGLPSGIDEDDPDFSGTGDPFTEFDEPTTDPFGEGETVFDDAATGEIDGEGVWERMDSVETDAEAVPGKRYVDVNKHSYCERCEHFSEPPEVSCTHEGTEILEFVDMETVRVMDCPIVEERKVLEETE